MKLFRIAFLLALTAASFSLAAADLSEFTLNVQVNDQEGHAVTAAVVLVEPYGLWAMTDDEGAAVIRKIPSEAAAQVSVSILGYKTWTTSLARVKEKERSLKVILEKESIAMDEVVVVAENKKCGESTASKIGRMAIDHLQATSLNDLLQLIPGQVSMSNPNLTQEKYFSIRSLYDNAGGSSVVMDGVPLSNNSSLESAPGVDLRSIGTDDLQSVEVIRGIASAEYGDVSSGTMIVNSKIGVTDLNVRAKIMPGIMQFYAGKGFKAGRAGNFNVSADYADGKSDPRYKKDTYHRILANVGHNKQLFDGLWDMTTKLSLTGIRDWSGADPGEPEAMQGYYKERKSLSIRFNHSGKLNLNRRFAGTVKYDFSYQNNIIRSKAEELTVAGGNVIFDAVEDGLYEGLACPRFYETVTGLRSNPVSWYAKVSDLFSLNAGRFLNRFNVGAEFRSEGNDGKGRYDESIIPAYAQGRIRDFCDIPYLNQFSIYAEDRFTIPLARAEYPRFKGQLGVRWTMIQPGKAEFMNSWSPRLNLSLDITDWVSIRGGYGQAEKLPNLMQLYPDKTYFDAYSLSVSNGKEAYYLYTTRVFDRTNPGLRPMRNNKFELGFDFRPHNGMSFSVTGYVETVKNGFGPDRSQWTAFQFPEWDTKDVDFSGTVPVFDREHPSRYRSVIFNLEKPGNTWWERNSGIEYDFDFGKIKATNTAFYLNGAYTRSETNSKNCYYQLPVGLPSVYSNVYVVFPEGTGSKSERRRFSSALRIVQHIPVIKFIVTATAQFIYYDYEQNLSVGEIPIGYITDDHQPESWKDGKGPVHFTAFTPEQLADPNYRFEGFYLKDQIYNKQISNMATIWPMIWTLNLRVTKEIGDKMGFSFYVNNMLFHQPWQKTSTSTNLIERNGSLFSYGLELFLHF